MLILASCSQVLIADLQKRENALQNLRDQADGIVGQRGSGADKTAELVREAISSVEGHLEMLRQQERRLKNNAPAYCFVVQAVDKMFACWSC